MSKYQLRKNNVIRYICMIMLMLIQFDAYAYDIIHSLVNHSDNSSSYVIDNDYSVDENKNQITEWKELDYSRANNRINLSSGIIFFIPAFIGLILPTIQKDDISSANFDFTPYTIRNVRQHVAYCTLII